MTNYGNSSSSYGAQKVPITGCARCARSIRTPTPEEQAAGGVWPSITPEDQSKVKLFVQTCISELSGQNIHVVIARSVYLVAKAMELVERFKYLQGMQKRKAVIFLMMEVQKEVGELDILVVMDTIETIMGVAKGSIKVDHATKAICKGCLIS